MTKCAIVPKIASHLILIIGIKYIGQYTQSFFEEKVELHISTKENALWLEEESIS